MQMQVTALINTLGRGVYFYSYFFVMLFWNSHEKDNNTHVDPFNRTLQRLV